MDYLNCLISSDLWLNQRLQAINGMPDEIVIARLHYVLQQFETAFLLLIVLGQWYPVVNEQIDEHRFFLILFFRHEFPLQKVLLVSVDWVYGKIGQISHFDGLDFWQAFKIQFKNGRKRNCVKWVQLDVSAGPFHDLVEKLEQSGTKGLDLSRVRNFKFRPDFLN